MKKLIQFDITILSPTDSSTAPAQIYYDGDDDAVNPVEIQLNYNNILYKGKGTDYLWVDAFADLQNKLPHNIKLACCMTCRHGNMCPYGNSPNEILCTKDLLISSKDDMIELFNKTDPYAERKVTSVNYCDDFVYQSNDYYTYNNYLYYLQKK